MRRDDSRPGFWRAALVAAGTGALFMVLYHLCNAYAADCGRLRMWYMDWELAIPVVDWLIVPYWSVDLLFAIAPFRSTRRDELWTLAGRITLAILLASACFVVWPLQCAHVRTSDHGIFSGWFAAIHGFDRPHNLFPSLHVAFAIILRWTYHRHLRGWARLLFHAWFLCISVSTVLVHQHHLVDVVGGIALALICFYAVDGSVLPTVRAALDRRSVMMASRLLAGAVVGLGLARWLGGWWWLLLWPSTALVLVGAGYLGLGSAVFRKRPDGLSWSAKVLLWPWLVPLCWSRRWWWRRDADGMVQIADGVWLGRLPDAELLRQNGIRAVLDLTAEHDGPLSIPGVTVVCIPLLDLATPPVAVFATAVETIERLRGHGPVLVHCALGYGRSVAVVAAWLHVTGRVVTPDEAVARVAVARPGAKTDIGWALPVVAMPSNT